MEVQRVPSQGGGTLREFYASRADDPASPSATTGRRMLALLDAFAAADGPPLWGETSHLALRLSAENGGGYWEMASGTCAAASELPDEAFTQAANFGSISRSICTRRTTSDCSNTPSTPLRSKW